MAKLVDGLESIINAINTPLQFSSFALAVAAFLLIKNRKNKDDTTHKILLSLLMTMIVANISWITYKVTQKPQNNTKESQSESNSINGNGSNIIKNNSGPITIQQTNPASTDKK